MITDFESAFYEKRPHFEGYEMKTPGFYLSSKSLEMVTSASLQQKMIYKDLYALGKMLLAILSPKWYQNIVKKQAVSASYHKQYLKNAFDDLPNTIQTICRKTDLMTEERHESVADLLKDIQKIVP